MARASWRNSGAEPVAQSSSSETSPATGSTSRELALLAMGHLCHGPSMLVQTSTPIHLASAARRIDSSAIRDLLHVIDRADVISLAGGLPAAETFPTAALPDAIADVLAHDPLALQYSTTEGFEPLRSWIATREHVEPNRVLVTHGSQQALDLVARALVDPGATVALADPGYVGAIQALRLAGARLEPVPSDADGLAVDVLADRL